MIDFDSVSGRLRLDQPAFGALLEHLDPDGPAADPVLVDELRAAGVLVDDQPAPALAPALRTVLGAGVQVRMTVASSSSAVFHQGWALGPTTALLVQTRGPVHELLTLPTLLVPGFIASTSRTGPRKVRADEPFELDSSSRDDLLSLDDDVRRTAFAAVRGAGPAPLADAEAMWTWAVEAAWPDRDGELAGSWLHVLESPVGTWLRGDAGFEPSSGTEVWRALTMLLPTDEDLAPDVLASMAAASR